MLLKALPSVLLLLASSSLAEEVIIPDHVISTADVGNWTVGNCLLAQFSMSFSLHANSSNPNATTHTISVAPYAKADSKQVHCGNTTQQLSLRWTDAALNDTAPLQRNLTIYFKRSNDTLYGVSRLYGTFEMGHFDWFNPAVNKTIPATSFVEVDTEELNPVMFTVPFKRSFQCQDLGVWSLSSEFHYSFSNEPHGKRMANATIQTHKVWFDAFRTTVSPPGVFRSPIDCDYQENDIVPIVVGCSLAAVVLFVLCAYMYGRRKNRQRGYQSV